MIRSLLLLPLLAWVAVSDRWITAYDQTLPLPTNVFMIPLSADTQLSVSVSWSGSNNLNLYLYANGKNFLDVSPSEYMMSSATLNNPEAFTYYEASGSIFYLRVDQQSGDPTEFTLDYTTRVGTNPSSNRHYVSTAFAGQSSFDLYSFLKIENTSFCKARVTYSGPNMNIDFIQPSKSYRADPFDSLYFRWSDSAPKQLDLPYQGYWTVVMRHNIASLTALRFIRLIIQIKDEPDQQCEKYTPKSTCSVGFKWDDHRKKCIVNLTIYIPIIASFLSCLTVIVCATAIFKYIVHRRQNTSVNIRVDHRQQMFERSLSELNLQQKAQPNPTACSICLEESQILAELSCGHIYHQNCIVAWIRKNNNCPLCRKTIISLPQ